MIESSANNRIKNINKLIRNSKERKKQQCYIIEGPKMVLEALEVGIVTEIFLSEKMYLELTADKSDSFDKNDLSGGNRYAGCSKEEFYIKLNKAGFEVVKDSVFNEITDTVSPQGVIAVVSMQDISLDEIFNGEFGITHYCNETTCMSVKRFIIIEDLQDPGNLGTIFRTTEAAGYNGILMNKGTVDAYNPKVVRSTMGAILRVPFIYFDNISDIISECHKRNIDVFGASLDGDDVRSSKFANCMAFIVGNESNGIKMETLDMCDNRIRIPMCGSTESLNASVAASIIMYLSNLPFM